MAVVAVTLMKEVCTAGQKQEMIGKVTGTVVGIVSPALRERVAALSNRVEGSR